MTLGIAIAGFVATVAAAFGGAWYGARLQRSSDTERLTLQLRIDSAAKFIGSAGQYISAYGLAWAPDTEEFTMTERQIPIFNAFVSVRSEAAAVGIVGPEELATLADVFLETAQTNGFSTSFDPSLVRELGIQTLLFIEQAKELRPKTGKSEHRKKRRGLSHCAS